MPRKHFAPRDTAPATIDIAKFTAHCTTLMPEVAASGRPLTVMKRGKPLVVIMPAESTPRQPFFGCLAGSVHILGDIESAVDESWRALND